MGFFDAIKSLGSRPGRAKAIGAALHARIRIERLENRDVMTVTNAAVMSVQEVAQYRGTALSKLDADLALISMRVESKPNATNPIALVPTTIQSHGYFTQSFVGVEIAAAGSVDALRRQLTPLGFVETSSVSLLVAGWLPMNRLDDLAKLGTVRYANLNYRLSSNVGIADNEGDVAMRSDVARTLFGVSGAGQKVGVISDSFNVSGNGSYLLDVQSGDLPPNIDVVRESSFGGTDEGRAMLQLVHDVAPGANLAFYTGVGLGISDAPLAQAIRGLAAAGSTVIVDDLSYFRTPFFQDGFAAQAVDEVVAAGIPYFSSAGNQARDSYESAYRATGQNLTIEDVNYGELHDFDPGAAVDTQQAIALPAFGSILLSFQWDQPFFSVTPSTGGSASSYSILLLDDQGAILASATTNVVGRDAVQVLSYFNDSEDPLSANLVITRVAGPVAGTMKYIDFDGNATVNEFATNSPTIYGHHNAIGAAAVGAAFYRDTPAFGQSPPLLESFSSVGVTPILFATNGTRLPAPEIRQQPRFVAPDGVTTTFFPSPAFPSFFGTSAAAPNAAAVAALMLQANPGLTPNQIYTVLENTAIPMPTPGFNFESGFGFIQADRAVGAVIVLEVTLAPVAEAAAVGGSTSAVATVTNSLTGQTLTGVPVSFTVTGVNPGSFTGIFTNASGQATLSYIGANLGTDTIVAQVQGGTGPVLSNFVTRLWTLAGSLAGSVYIDSNQNGERDPGELGVPLTMITLTGLDAAGASIRREILTDQNGDFLFSLLSSGGLANYTLTATQPVAYLKGQQSAPGLLPPVIIGDNTFSGIFLAAGDDLDRFQFGQLGLSSAYVSKRLFFSSTSQAVVPGDVTSPSQLTALVTAIAPQSFVYLPVYNAPYANYQPITPIGFGTGSTTNSIDPPTNRSTTSGSTASGATASKTVEPNRSRGGTPTLV